MHCAFSRQKMTPCHQVMWSVAAGWQQVSSVKSRENTQNFEPFYTVNKNVNTAH